MKSFAPTHDSKLRLNYSFNLLEVNLEKKKKEVNLKISDQH